MNDLQELVVHLLMVAQSYTGYGLPAEPPELRFVPQIDLQEAACDRPCQVFGWFPPGKTIYLDDRLDPLHDIRARGILLHELTHYLQQTAGAYSEASACQNWANREREAFRLQARWLAEQGASVSAWPGPGAAPWTLACRQEGLQEYD